MSFRFFLAAFILVATLASAQEKYRVYLGTYTGKVSKGIYQCELNLKDGSLSEATLAGETSSPSFLAFHPNKKFLYAVNEGQATVSAFAIDDRTGNLTFLNSQPSQGGAPCHLVVDPTGQNVLAANYSGGSCICIPIEADGKLGKASSFQQHVGKRTNGHSIHVDQANKFALCCDLGLDKVFIYAFDADKGTLTPHGAFDTPKGSGPRHFAWHPDGKTAYINGESNLTIIACDYDADKGVLTQKQVLSTLPSDVVRKGGSTAETVVHPSGKFVYVSNRDPYNSIAIFSIDPQTHELTAVGHQGMGVKTHRQLRHRADRAVHVGREPIGRERDRVSHQSSDWRVDADQGQRASTQPGVRAVHGDKVTRGSAAETGEAKMTMHTFVPTSTSLIVLAAFYCLRVDAANDGDPDALRRAMTFYASFDAEVRGDVGGGGLLPATRYDHPSEKSAFVFEPAFDSNVVRIAKEKGIRGGALECVDVLPRRGRIFFPVKGNLAYHSDGWGGSVSMWLKTDPNRLLKTPFCDPVQITEKGASDGGVWCDFPDSKPRDMRMGAFRALAEGEKAIPESDPEAPLIVVKNVGFQSSDWHHVTMTWNHFDSSKHNAEATLYIDGKVAGRLADREIAMRWDADRAGIYVAVNYIGLLDELALFDRPLTATEVRYLHERPEFDLWSRKPFAEVDFKPSIDFVKLPQNMSLGACSAVATNSKGEIFLFHRGEHPIIVLDAKGNYLRSWGEDEIETAHGLRIDGDDNVWITDIGSHRVLKFDPTGKLLLAQGTGKPGTGDDQFNRPTDIAFGTRGEIYISDGYGNSRVLQFTPGGRLIRSWGAPGRGRGQFNLPHSILVDWRGRVLVGDRENNRIQVFDSNGTLLDIWQGFAPYGMATDRTGNLYVADGRANKILRLNESGHVVQSWGGKGTAPGRFHLPHMLCFDKANHLYVAEVNGKRLQQFTVTYSK